MRTESATNFLNLDSTKTGTNTTKRNAVENKAIN